MKQQHGRHKGAEYFPFSTFSLNVRGCMFFQAQRVIANATTSSLQPFISGVFFNVFMNDAGAGLECMLSKFPNDTNRRSC